MSNYSPNRKNHEEYECYDKVFEIMCKNGLTTIEQQHLNDFFPSCSGFSMQDIKSKKRYRPMVVSRQIFHYLMFIVCKEKILNIGKDHNRHHSTVIHSIRSVEDLFESDVPYKNKFESIILKIVNKIKDEKNLFVSEDK